MLPDPQIALVSFVQKEIPTDYANSSILRFASLRRSDLLFAGTLFKASQEPTEQSRRAYTMVYKIKILYNTLVNCTTA